MDKQVTLLLYRQRRVSRSAILTIITLGIIFGTGFYVFDNVIVPARNATPTPFIRTRADLYTGSQPCAAGCHFIPAGTHRARADCQHIYPRPLA